MNDIAGKIIYISGRYRARTIFGRLLNIWLARRVAIKIWKLGGIAICPHMNTALFPEDGIDYIEGDCEIVERCDAILLLRNWRKSKGARRELATALSKRLRLYYE